MGQKKNSNQGENKAGGETKDAVVLKVDMHCDACVKKAVRSIMRIQGVEDVKGDNVNNKITVIGKVDPLKLREKVELKMKKNVEIISPQPKKEDKGNGGADDKKTTEAQKNPEKKPPAVETVVLKMALHCDGCIQKLKKSISKLKGVETVAVDPNNDLVTVKGTVEAKALQSLLKDKFKKDVDIVPPKKDEGGGKSKNGGGEKKKGDDKKDKGGGGNHQNKESEELVKADTSKMDYIGQGFEPGYGYGYEYGYGNGQMHGYNAPPPQMHGYNAPSPQMFSDENPNACAIM